MEGEEVLGWHLGPRRQLQHQLSRMRGQRVSWQALIPAQTVHDAPFPRCCLGSLSAATRTLGDAVAQCNRPIKIAVDALCAYPSVSR